MAQFPKRQTLAEGNIRLFARAFRLVGDTPVQDGAAMLLYISEVSDYRCGVRTFIASCRNSFYSAVSLDPADHNRFYVLGSYAGAWAAAPPRTTVLARWRKSISEISVQFDPIFDSGFEASSR